MKRQAIFSAIIRSTVDDGEQRIIRGTATTPRPDRIGDVVESLGVSFVNPLPLLHQHDPNRPVGTVNFGKPTKDGIAFEAHIPKITEPGPLKDRVDTAWGEVKSGLVRSVSIGFRPIEQAYIEGGGVRFLRSEILELSLVSVPANPDAQISLIKARSGVSARGPVVRLNSPAHREAEKYIRSAKRNLAAGKRQLAKLQFSMARALVPATVKARLDIGDIDGAADLVTRRRFERTRVVRLGRSIR
jgi:HK97 family phage prohead protease